MKIKVILLTIIVSVGLLFGGNWIYGNQIAKKLDAQLKVKIAQNEMPVVVAYLGVHVNPLFSKVEISGLNIMSPNSEILFECATLKMEIPYKEALNLSGNNKINEIKSMQFKLVKPSIIENSSKSKLEFDNIVIDFDGHLNKMNLDSIQNQFPEEPQKLNLSFSNMNFDGVFAKQYLNKEMFNKLVQVDKGNCSLIYKPDSKELVVKDLLVSSSVISFESNSIIKYSGNGLSNYKSEQIDTKTDIQIKPIKIGYDEDNKMGKFSLEKLSLTTESSYKFDKRKLLPNGNFSLLVKGLKGEVFKNDTKSAGLKMLGINLDKIDVDKLTVNYELKEDRLTIDNTELRSSLGDLMVDANILVNPNSPMMSDIKDANVVFKNLSAELKASVASIEMFIGPLPRKGNNITLEISGMLIKPQIKGMKF